MSGKMWADEIDKMSSELGKKIADAEEEALRKHIIDYLAVDKHFLKWFKKHYDFYIVREPLRIEPLTVENFITINTKYKASVPHWITLKERVVRKFVEIVHSVERF